MSGAPQQKEKDENNKKTKENNLVDKANVAADLEKKLENMNADSETTAEKLKKESERKEPIKGAKRFFNIIRWNCLNINIINIYIFIWI